MNKKGFIVYTDYLQHIELLSVEERGHLFTALLKYADTEELIELSPLATMAFSFIRAQMARDADKHLEFCEKQRENGKKGGRPRKEEKPKNPSLFLKTQKSHTDTDTDTEKDTDIFPPLPPFGTVEANNKQNSPKGKITAWRKDFEVYLSEEKSAYEALLTDAAWFAKRQKYHPKLDIGLTLEKAHHDFWGTEAGWQNAKQRRGAVIDWRRTFANAVSQRLNWVYKHNSFGAAGNLPAQTSGQAHRENRAARECQQIIDVPVLNCATGGSNG